MAPAIKLEAELSCEELQRRLQAVQARSVERRGLIFGATRGLPLGPWWFQH